MSFVEVTRKGNRAYVFLKKEPVNSLNSEFWSQLKTAFDELEADEGIKGVVFSSGLSRKVFTAGQTQLPKLRLL